MKFEFMPILFLLFTAFVTPGTSVSANARAEGEILDCRNPRLPYVSVGLYPGNIAVAADGFVSLVEHGIPCEPFPGNTFICRGHWTKHELNGPYLEAEITIHPSESDPRLLVATLNRPMGGQKVDLPCRQSDTN